MVVIALDEGTQFSNAKIKQNTKKGIENTLQETENHIRRKIFFLYRCYSNTNKTLDITTNPALQYGIHI